MAHKNIKKFKNNGSRNFFCSSLDDVEFEEFVSAADEYWKKFSAETDFVMLTGEVGGEEVKEKVSYVRESKEFNTCVDIEGGSCNGKGYSTLIKVIDDKPKRSIVKKNRNCSVEYNDRKNLFGNKIEGSDSSKHFLKAQLLSSSEDMSVKNQHWINENNHTCPLRAVIAELQIRLLILQCEAEQQRIKEIQQKSLLLDTPPVKKRNNSSTSDLISPLRHASDTTLSYALVDDDISENSSSGIKNHQQDDVRKLPNLITRKKKKLRNRHERQMIQCKIQEKRRGKKIHLIPNLATLCLLNKRLPEEHAKESMKSKNIMNTEEHNIKITENTAENKSFNAFERSKFLFLEELLTLKLLDKNNENKKLYKKTFRSQFINHRQDSSTNSSTTLVKFAVFSMNFLKRLLWSLF